MTSFPLEIKDLFSRPGAPSYPFHDDRGQLCWVEAITERGGILAIKQQTPAGSRTLTSGSFQIRTRVHEYGGQCFCCVAGDVYFNNFADGLIYRQSLHDDEMPVPISIETSSASAYADLHYSSQINILIAVQELTAEDGQDNISRIVAFDLKQDGCMASEILCEGADFYANPCISPDGHKLAWTQWQQPNMPWDESSLYYADISKEENGIVLSKAKKIAGDHHQSICQAGFLSNGDLLFAMDAEAAQNSAQNYWNLYRAANAEIHSITEELAEFGEAHWIFGQRRWVQLDEQTLLAIRTQNDTDQLLEINLASGKQIQRGDNYARLSQLYHAGAKTLCIASHLDKPPQILTRAQDGSISFTALLENWIDPATVSLPQSIAYPTRDGAQAHANYYPANASNNRASALLVLVHGGPTSRADAALSPLVQYFCQNNFAVLDVNHRGSTGHGRAYRQALLGQWGEIDADDIADAIEYIVQQKSLNPKRVFIRGGSAGGYAVLRALTRFPKLFRGGACYYGIGNLITLAEITHKFEGHYTDQLIGEVYTPATANQAESRFMSRSPIFDIEHIQSPLILFQGLEDKVVPPAVSREMVQTLAQNGVKHEYVEYSGEGHGFRKAETRIDALKREFAFFKQLLMGP